MRFRRSIGRRSASTSSAAAATRSAFRPPVEALEDRRLFAITLASAGPGGVAAAVPGVENNNPAVSDDGRFVVFASTANNLVAGDANDALDVFVRDRQTNAVTLVSAAPDGSAGNGASGDPGGFRIGYAISGNGRYVVFASDATDLVTGKTDANDLTDYFVRDLQTGQTSLVTASPTGDYSTDSTFGGTNGRPAISDDGRFVTFTATFGDLDPAVDDNDGNQPDVFVRDLTLGETTQVSAPAADATGGGNVSASPTISSDGRYVAFTSGDRLVDGLDEFTFNFEQLWVYDTTTDTITLASLAPDGTTHANGHITNPVISGDGRSVAFLSSATNLVAGFTENNTPGADGPDVYLRNLNTNATLLVSRAAGSTGTGSNGDNETPSVSSNGRFVAWYSEATNLVAGVTDANEDTAGSGNDVFFFDATTGETKLLSVNAVGNAAGNQTSVDIDGDDERGPAMSDDGRYVAFVSSATDLVSGDENVLPEVFVRDTQNNTTRRVYAGLTIPGTSTPILALGGAPTLAGNGSALAFNGSGFGIAGSADTTANNVFVDDMTGTNNGGNDGGNDGGNNDGGGTLVPTVTATLPSAVVGGAKARGASATVNVTNNGTTAFSGPVTVTLFASQNATFESGTDTQIVTTTKRLKLAPGQSKAVKLKIAQFPSVADGNYALLAQVSGTGITAATGVTGNTVNIAAPFVDLSGAFSQSPASAATGKKAKAAVTVTNAGNVDAKGTVPVVITASTDPSGASPVTIATVNARLSLKAGTSKAVKLSFALPADIASGSYFLSAAIDSANAIAESNETNNTATATTATAVA